MKVIRKYLIEHPDAVRFNTTFNSKVLRVGLDGEGKPAIWVLEDFEASDVYRRWLYVVINDEQWGDQWEYIGSYSQGHRDFHVFQDGAEPWIRL